MRFKLLAFSTLTASLLAPLFPAFSQVVPAYQGRSLDMSVGGGGSSWDVDWGHGRMYGGAIWADWYPGFVPSILNGLGVEIEARNISLDRSSSQPNIRQDTLGGGPIYSWRHFRDFHPYFKYLEDWGSYDFTIIGSYYSHTDMNVRAPGGGFEYRVFRPLWVRADYEYQFWQPISGNETKTPNPQGFTVGFAYDFSHPRPR